MNALLTDLYELTMAAGYVQAGIAQQRGTFELSIRSLPRHRNFLLAAGLAQAVDYLLNLRFAPEEIAYLRGLPQFARAPEEFFQILGRLRFTGDVFAVPEGTPLFAGEPVLTIRAPLIEAQIVETYLLSLIGFETLIATKASRITEVAAGRAVVEFGTRRAHSPEAGVLAGRAAYIGGCVGTSNALTGFRYGVPVFGTTAHSWVLAFEQELEAHRQIQKLLGEGTAYLIDTYDTIEGARQAASLGPPLWGVRLDSGDLVELSFAVRKVFDDAGLPHAKIMASGELNEYKIRTIIEAGAPVDAFGVGTELSTSADAPAIGAIYKLVELEERGGTRYTAKFSAEKATLPGAKQIFRFPACDVIGRAQEELGGAAAEALLKPVIAAGRLVAPLPAAAVCRDHAAASIARLPDACRRLEFPECYRVEHSQALQALAQSLAPAARYNRGSE